MSRRASLEADTQDGRSGLAASAVSLLAEDKPVTHVVLLGVHGHVLFLQFHHYIHIPLIILHFIQGSRNISLLKHLTDAEEKYNGDLFTYFSRALSILTPSSHRGTYHHRHPQLWYTVTLRITLLSPCLYSIKPFWWERKELPWASTPWLCLTKEGALSWEHHLPCATADVYRVSYIHPSHLTRQLWELLLFFKSLLWITFTKKYTDSQDFKKVFLFTKHESLKSTVLLKATFKSLKNSH